MNISPQKATESSMPPSAPGPLALQFRQRVGLGFGALLAAAILVSACPATQSSPVEQVTEAEDSYSIVVSGHFYSLFARNKIMSKSELIFTEESVKSFADELRRLKPRAAFFLGDNTRFGLKEEWEMITRNFADLDMQQVWVAGNHDYRDISTLVEIGGYKNASLVIGKNKFVTLDAKTIFEAEDLAFLESELEDHESYDHVFLMMHLYLPATLDLTPETEGEQPHKAYTGYSNWNRDVVPLIAGKVEYVFTGDYYPRQTGRVLQNYEEHEIHYIRNSFLFRRGIQNDNSGDGPMLYLELKFEGSDFSIIPRALPVDLKSSWYEDFAIPARFREPDMAEPKTYADLWSLHEISDVISVPLPRDWVIERDVDGAVLVGKSRDSLFDLRVYEYELNPKIGLAKFERGLLNRAAEEYGSELPVEERGAVKAGRIFVRWMISPFFNDPKVARGINFTLAAKGRGYLITCALPDRAKDFRQSIADLTLLYAVAEKIKVED